MLPAASRTAEKARDEISDLIAAGELSHAFRRLLDFARDFTEGRELENEAVSLSARFNLMRKRRRKVGQDPANDAQRNELIGDLIDLADEIQRKAKPPKGPALQIVGAEAGPGVSAGIHLVNPRQHADSEPVQASEKKESSATRLEKERNSFFHARRREKRNEVAAPAFRCQDLRKRYRRGATDFELAGLNLEIYPGEITGVVGVNGAGKTTVLRLIAGELRPSEGSISYPFLASGTRNWAAIRQQIAYVAQMPQHWYGRLAENLHLYAAVKGFRGQENADEVEFILQRLGLDEFRDHTWNEISGGFQMRFELARALISRPKLLVLDEPLAPLDVLTQQLFLQDLRDLANLVRNPLAIIVSSQHLYEIESVADQILFIDAGSPMYCGQLADLGRNRSDNVFEISGVFSRADMDRRIRGVKILDIEALGRNYYIRVPRTVSSADFLNAILSAGFEIEHFRNISRSTRRLFDSKLDLL